MTFLDFFSGIGTIRIGMEQAGHECVGHVEWDKFAQQSYMAMHEVKEDEYIGWDICAVRADELPRADCWWFGAPCQDFSIAGKRKGMDGERSSLVNEIFRLVEETEEENRPTWLLYENVKGMLSSNGGWDFLGILLEMDRLGYDVEWQLLNSKHFGVPQNRERAFTLGHLRGRGGRKVFPIGESNGTADELQGQHVGTLTTRTGAGGSVGTYLIEGERLSQEIKQVGQIYGTEREPNPQAGRIISPEGISQSLDTCSGGNRMPKIAIPCLTPDRIEKRQNGRRFKEDGDPMFTLTAQDVNGVMLEPKIIDDQGRVKDSYKQHDIVPTLRAQTHGNTPKLVNGFRIRKLTPKECWRLQGISDDYFERAKASGVSDSQLYKQAGNACTVNVICEIAKRLGEEQ